MSTGSDSLFKGTFELAAVGIATVALDGRFSVVNQKFCEIVGYQTEELTSLKFQDITHKDDLLTDEKLVEQVLSGALDTYTLEKRYLHKSGHVVWVSLTVSLSRSVTGQPL